MRIARSFRPRRALKRDSCKSERLQTAREVATQEQMQELLQGLQVLTARIAALERASMAKGKESRTVLRRSTLRVSC